MDNILNTKLILGVITQDKEIPTMKVTSQQFVITLIVHESPPPVPVNVKSHIQHRYMVTMPTFVIPLCPGLHNSIHKLSGLIFPRTIIRWS